MEPVELALARFEKGYSCSQSVFSALAEQRGVDADLAFRIAAGFGGGIARSGETCGCVIGAIMAIGLEQRGVSPEENKKEKEKTCEVAQRFLREFEARNASTDCRNLLGCEIGTAEGMKHARENKLFQTRCVKFIRDAVEIAVSI
jgi:C_GCAxxG_C_C family probable redox protein